MTRNVSLRITTHNRVPLPDKVQIQLTEPEDHICTLLDECTNWMKETGDTYTSCRIAGGWVRDKLLGSPCNDIDIALEDMMGMPFAQKFVEFCSSVKHIHVDKIAKIESNPDRSKHLETARTSILGIELDFVNLRSEEYAEDSRIPHQIAFGTPLEDALRRDLTINSLFYNIHTRSVEDHTNKGLEDLREGIIRTPLPPKETFMDDPLRVLRCVRFASRFGFDLADELAVSARDPEIQEALCYKISRERVGEELDKMMQGRDPLRAIQIIHDLSLYFSIFHIPSSVAPELSAPLAADNVALAACSILHFLTQPPSLTSPTLPPLHPLLSNSISHNKLVAARLYLACALFPFHGVTYQDSKARPRLAAEAAIRESLKLGTQNHYLDGIPALFFAVDVLKNPKVDPVASSAERRIIGLLLRDRYVHNHNTGSFWATSLLFSLVSELVPLWNAQLDQLDVDRAAERINAYNAFVSRAVELDLPSTVDAKPILDGREVVRIVGASSPGRWTGDVLARVIEWQLEFPEGSKDQCEEWLRSEVAAGKIVVPPVEVNGKRHKQPDSQTKKKKKVDSE
ncbi:hypothetical protein C8Q75DRAFT_713370 [Abortiporus biennis]|nr:hypothetical protein C8Q75DRAFT_713370 [Abortiporus biennis]